MGDKTLRNVHMAFVGEAKAYFRLLAYAEAANEEKLPEIAALFRAVAEAERIHATRSLRLLGEVMVQDSEANLQASFEREKAAAGVLYPQYILDAEEEEDPRAALSFSHARDVEEGHAGLYKRALQHLISATVPVYRVCQVCGYIAEGDPLATCPICDAPVEQFRQVL